MRQIRVLRRGPAVVLGLLALWIALGAWAAVLHDLRQLGLHDSWSLWTGTTRISAGVSARAVAGDVAGMPMSTVNDLAIGTALVVAGLMALAGARTAGGALAATVWIAITLRVPVVWSALRSTAWTPWYRPDRGGSSAAAWSGLDAVQSLFFLAVCVVLLLAGRGPARVCPARPGRGAALTSAVLLAAFAAFGVGWNLHLATEAGGTLWLRSLTGEDMITAGLGAGPAWLWTLQALVCAAAAVLAGTRSVAARGFTIAVSVFMLVIGAAALVAYLRTGTLLELGGTSPKAAFFGRLETVLEVAGPVLVIPLMARRGRSAPEQPVAPPHVPAPSPGWQPPPPPQQPPAGYGQSHSQSHGHDYDYDYDHGHSAPPVPPPGAGFGPPPQS